MRSHLWNHLLCFISMEKQIIFFWIAGFFLPAINATVFTNILVVPMSRMYHLSIWNLFIINFTLKTTFRKPQNSFRHDWLSTRNYFWNNADSKYLAQSYSMIALIDVGGSSEFMGKTFQAAQLTHERFLTVDHSCKIFSLISAQLNFHRTFSTTHQRSVEVQFGRYQKNFACVTYGQKSLMC